MPVGGYDEGPLGLRVRGCGGRGVGAGEGSGGGGGGILGCCYRGGSRHADVITVGSRT